MQGVDLRPETKIKNALRRVIGGWSESYETRAGSGVGYPDLQFLVGTVLLPVEVKCGAVVGGRLLSSEIRPSQIAWHHRFLHSGGRAWIVVGFWNARGHLCAWAIPSGDRGVTSAWKQGWELRHCTQWVDSGAVKIDLRSLVADAIVSN